jgi:hypothetical protein
VIALDVLYLPIFFSSQFNKGTKTISSHSNLPTIVIMTTTTSLIFTMLIITVPTCIARLNMRDIYRIDVGSQKESPTKAGNDLFSTDLWRNLEIETEMSMPVDTMSMPVDETMSFDNAMSMSMPFFVGGGDMAMPIFAMSMPTCDATYTCPAAGTCDCGGNVQDGANEICGCYTIRSVDPPFDTSSVPAKGTWYCYEVYLDKSVAGCSSAKAVSHAVLPTGFSESCHFYQGGRDSAGSDNWSDHTCDNTAATGLKFDFGHEGAGSKLSVTYCIDVSCEAAPAGEGSINWVFKAGNDRCDIQVTEGAIPNCGVSSDLCHPSCSAGDSSSSSGGGNGGNVGGPKKLNSDPDAGSAEDGSKSKKSRIPMVASIVGVAGVVALAGVTYKVVAQKNSAAAALGGDASSISSADTPL